jgi:hypothetical protein
MLSAEVEEKKKYKMKVKQILPGNDELPSLQRCVEYQAS